MKKNDMWKEELIDYMKIIKIRIIFISVSLKEKQKKIFWFISSNVYHIFLYVTFFAM